MSNDDENHKNGSNGAGHAAPLDSPTAAEAALLAASPPAAIAELAEACVRYVERAIGVTLDYTLETLPLLDHYLEGARDTLRDKKKGKTDTESPTLSILAQTAGAYFGEVIRRRHASWWRLDAEPEEHRLEFHHVFLVVKPVTLMLDALTLDPTGKAPAGLSGFDLDEEDRGAAAVRLAELPPVPLEEYVSPSTRLEVLDIVVDAVRAYHMSQGIPVQELEPGDYLDG